MDLSGMEAGMYLRKSRAEDGQDTDAILRRHRDTLTEYAQKRGIHIIETYPEVVSGESLYARPQMLRLLEDVEANRYQCVLCMDMDRLSRGSMRDQGIILDAFKYSATLIVTPEKTYDLSVETDEQYAELKTFISRQEYKQIRKRLQRGLHQSISDGCYVANAPYGYKQVYIARKPTLEIYEPEAKYVRMMFQLYADGYGCVSVARQINAMGARPHRSAEFSRNSVKKILNNPVYIGKVVWNQKSHIKKGTRGNPKHITVYNPKEKWTIVDGIHPAIIERDLWDKVQAISDGRYTPPKNDGTIKSSLAGLVRCKNCGSHMQKLQFAKGGPYLLCTRPGCCASAKYGYVENALLLGLGDILDTLAAKSEPDRNSLEIRRSALKEIQESLDKMEKAKAKLYELVEAGAYSIEEFRSRMDLVKAKEAKLQRDKREASLALEAAQNADSSQQVARIKNLLEVYQSESPAGKNALLRGIIEVVWYTKEKKTKPMDFKLEIVLKNEALF